MHRHILESSSFYLTEQRRQRSRPGVLNRFMRAEASVRINVCRPIVSAGLTDIAIGDGRNLRAIPITIAGFACGAAAQLSGCYRRGWGSEEEGERGEEEERHVRVDVV